MLYYTDDSGDGKVKKLKTSENENFNDVVRPFNIDRSSMEEYDEIPEEIKKELDSLIEGIFGPLINPNIMIGRINPYQANNNEAAFINFIEGFFKHLEELEIEERRKNKEEDE